MTSAPSPQEGQSIVLVIGMIGVALLVVAVLGAFGQGMLGKGRHQRAADLAAICAAQVMNQLHPRLFEPARMADGSSNPNHVTKEAYLTQARRAAVGCARANGAPIGYSAVGFPDGASVAPVRVEVVVRGRQRITAGQGGSVAVRGRAEAELVPLTPAPGAAAGEPSAGAYAGPLEYRQGKPMRPDVAVAFDRLAAAARSEAGIALTITSAFRTDAEQAALFAANPDPKWVAPPGTSLHRLGTELDLGPPSAHGWLAANGERFGFRRRYSWEPWH